MNIVHGLRGPLLSEIRSAMLPPLYMQDIEHTQADGDRHTPRARFVVVLDPENPPLPTVGLFMVNDGRERDALNHFAQQGEDRAH